MNSIFLHYSPYTWEDFLALIDIFKDDVFYKKLVKGFVDNIEYFKEMSEEYVILHCRYFLERCNISVEISHLKSRNSIDKFGCLLHHYHVFGKDTGLEFQ
jgi:hypothetical protein